MCMYKDVQIKGITFAYCYLAGITEVEEVYECTSCSRTTNACMHACMCQCRYLKACRSNIPSLLRFNTICRKNMHASLDC